MRHGNNIGDCSNLEKGVTQKHMEMESMSGAAARTGGLSKKWVKEVY